MVGYGPSADPFRLVDKLVSRIAYSDVRAGTAAVQIPHMQCSSGSALAGRVESQTDIRHRTKKEAPGDSKGEESLGASDG